MCEGKDFFCLFKDFLNLPGKIEEIYKKNYIYNTSKPTEVYGVTGI
jgi:hypothetical protein